MADPTDGISLFVETVQAGSFAAAATRLHLSRSAVGKAIARLEGRLSVRLFHRTTRTQSLTNDGQAYYEHCLRALDEIRSAEAMLDLGRHEATGRLRVSMPVLYGRHCVAPILIDLVRQHPNLELDLNFSDRRIEMLEDGFDLAIRNGALPDEAGLMVRKLASQRMTVCASPDYLEAHGKPRSVADLASHSAVLYCYSYSDRIRTWLFPTEVGPNLEITPKSRLRLDDLEAIAEAAVAGMGLAWLPCWLIRNRVRSGELVTVLENEAGFVFDVYALWPQSPHLPMRVRLAIDALVTNLPIATA